MGSAFSDLNSREITTKKQQDTPESKSYTNKMKKYFNHVILSMHQLKLITDWQQSVMVEVWKDHKWRQNFRMGKVTFRQSG